MYRSIHISVQRPSACLCLVRFQPPFFLSFPVFFVCVFCFCVFCVFCVCHFFVSCFLFVFLFVFSCAQRIHYYDSMGGGGQTVTNSLLLWLEDEDEDKNKNRATFDPDCWTTVGTKVSTTPQQVRLTELALLHEGCAKRFM